MEEVSHTLEMTPALIAAGAVLGIGLIMSFITWIILVVKGFQTGVGWGILNLLLPFPGAIIFAAMNWSRGGGAMIAYLIGGALFMGGYIGAIASGVMQQIDKEMEIEYEDPNSQLYHPKPSLLETEQLQSV